MSHWAHNVDYFETKFREFAMRGDFGPELQKLAEEGDIGDWEIYYKLSEQQQMDACEKADRAWWEEKLEAADARRKAERENFHE